MVKKIISNEMVSLLCNELESYKKDLQLQEVGRVVSVRDAVVTSYGLDNARMGEMIEFFSEPYKTSDNPCGCGIVQSMSESTVDVILLKGANEVSEGNVARRTNSILSIPVGTEMLGRVVDVLGNPIDGKGEIATKVRYPIERPVPSVIDRQSVREPVCTGWKCIDCLIPIGRGQRELIIGDRKTGKTTLAMDIILNQKKYNESVQDPKQRMHCVYVAIAHKQSSVANIYKRLEEGGAMDYTTIVLAGAAEPAAMQYLAPYSGCSIAEYFRDNSMHCIVIYDDLSKHAVAYREISLLLRNPPGREAYPGDVFYLHSRLLERAAKMSEKCGGGSLTAIPIVETQADDVSTYIPTNVISITDGQIFLRSTLFNNGILPAIDVGLSVSRVGSAAQTPAIKKLAGSAKLELAQYRELEDFARFGSELDQSTQRLLQRGRRMVELFKQNKHNGMSFAEQAVVLFANNNGYLDDIDVTHIQDFEQNMIAAMNSVHHEIIRSLNTRCVIDEEMDIILRKALDVIKADFINTLTAIVS